MDLVLGSNLLAGGAQLLILGHLCVYLEFLNQQLLLSQLFFDGGAALWTSDSFIIISYFGLEDAFDDSMPVCSLLTQDGYSR